MKKARIFLTAGLMPCGGLIPGAQKNEQPIRLTAKDCFANRDTVMDMLLTILRESDRN